MRILPMARRRAERRLAAAVLPALLLAGASQACAQGAAQDRAAQFARFDVNEDGILSGTELRACDCRAADTDRNGRVTRAEFLRGVATAKPPAAPAGGAARTASADAPIAHTPWPAMGTHQVGDRVRYRAAATLWYDGVVTEVGPSPKMPEISKQQYLIEGRGGDGWYDHMMVAGTERAPYWTGFFVGDWEVSVPMAMNTKVIGNDLYRVVSGGMRLPPLRVNPDGTYAWRVMDGQGGERVIHGRWVPREDAPGIILQKGEKGGDWELYHNTDASARRTFGRTQIYLSSDCCTAQTAARVPSQPVGTLRPGDRVFQLRENGSYLLGTVTQVERGRARLEFQYHDPAWVRLEELRRAEW